MKKSFLLSFLLMLISCFTLSATSLELFCDGEINPQGVDDPNPAFSWKLKTPRRNVIQRSYRIKVYDSGSRCVWDSGTVIDDNCIGIRYAGEALKPGSGYSWEVETRYRNCPPVHSVTATFSTGLYSDSDWEGAKWISYEPSKPFHRGLGGKYIHSWCREDKLNEAAGVVEGDYAHPQFRREFTPASAPVSAILYVCGLGQFECYMNGNKVGDHFLDPGWTQYDKEALYVTFDVLPYLREGSNALGVMLGGGFYNIPNVRYYKIYGSMGAPKMRALLRLRYADGTCEDIVSDGSWRSSRSAITYGSIYRGEGYDASAEQAGWNRPGFDDSRWSAPLVSENDIVLRSQRSYPLTVRMEMPSLSFRRTSEGYLFDMGQNFSGIFEISVRGARGCKVSVTPAELLDGDKPFQVGTGEPHVYEYTLAGTGTTETWRPRFCYYGQRWFLVSGAVPSGEPNPCGLPVLTGFKGLHTCASAPAIGSFKCSNTLYNDIYRLTDWAFRSNFASVFTDCPHREKLGWQEQTYLMFPAFAHMYDVERHFLKTLQDVAVSQWPNGCIPTIAPEYVRFESGFEDTPEWGSALIIDSWNLYEWYGNDSCIRRYYPAMKRYADYLAGRAGDDGIIAYGLNDWLCVDERTSLGVTSHLVYCVDLQILSRMARMLGLEAEAAEFGKRFSDAAEAFNRRFWNEDTGTYDNDTQADYALAIASGVVPEVRMDLVYRRLLEAIDRAGAITTGEVAHPYLIKALSDRNLDSVYSHMHQQREKPGYGYMIDRGSTTLTEAWNGSLSQNHFANGHIVQWFYENLAGIRQAEGSTAFRHLLVKPVTVDEVDWVECSFETAFGTVASNWRKEGDGIVYHIEIPPCCDARIVLPGLEKNVGSGIYDFRF